MKFKFYALKLCGIMIVIFIMQLLVNGFTEFFVLNQEAYTQWWRFLTAIFLHGDIVHLLYNLFALALFGSMLESLIGARRFWIIFFGTGILANLFSVMFYPSSLGASGAIFGIIGALIVIRPMQFVWAFGLPLPIFIAGILWAIGDLFGAYAYFSGNPIDSTGNLAHLSGMIVGLLLGAVYRNWKGKNRRMPVRIDEGSMRLWEEAYMR